MESKKTGGLNFKRNFISGLLTLVPLGITWLLLDFVFRQLSKMGKPLVRALYTDIRDDAPELAKLVIQPWFDDLLAVVLIVLAIYGLGWLTNRLVGRQILKGFEAVARPGFAEHDWRISWRDAVERTALHIAETTRGADRRIDRPFLGERELAHPTEPESRLDQGGRAAQRGAVTRRRPQAESPAAGARSRGSQGERHSPPWWPSCYRPRLTVPLPRAATRSRPLLRGPVAACR